MFAIILKRCLGSIPLLLLLTVVTFVMIKILPGDPVDVMLGSAQKDIASEQALCLRREMGLDQPPINQYSAWLTGIVTRGEFGRSYRDMRPVLCVITERLPATLLLVTSALILTFTLGIAWGLTMVFLNMTGLNHRLVFRLCEKIMVSSAVILYSAPSFWVGLLVIAQVSRSSCLASVPILGFHDPGTTAWPQCNNWTDLGLLPGSLASLAAHLFMPAAVLASRRTAKVALFLRSASLEEISKDYVMVARSKGLGSAQILIKHIARNSLSPVISLLGLSLPAILGGSILVESVFGWPGIGRLAVDATFGRNYPVIMALVLLYGALVILSSLLADLAQMIVDPRTRSSDSKASQQAKLEI